MHFPIESRKEGLFKIGVDDLKAEKKTYLKRIFSY